MIEGDWFQGFDARHQHLIVMPTEACNFRCSYCYEDFALGHMKDEVILGLERFLTRRIPDLHTLSLSWFGGEPLLALPTILRLGNLAQALCRQYGVELLGSITTNGYRLGEDVFHQLVALSVRSFQISLDGYGQAHDVTRRRADGTGTFDQIWKNITRLADLDHDACITIRVHYSEQNFQDLPILLKELAKLSNMDSRFSIALKPIENLGGPNAHNIAKWNAARRNEVYDYLQSFLNNSTATVSPEGCYICYASRPNSLLVRSDGRIGKCTVALSSERNTVGHLREDGSLSLDQERLSYWFRGFFNMNPSQLACPAGEN
jgi:uncharacterized protein